MSETQTPPAADATPEAGTGEATQTATPAEQTIVGKALSESADADSGQGDGDVTPEAKQATEEAEPEKGEEKSEPEAKTDEKDAPEGAPESYDFTMPKAPEGFVVEDSPLVSEVGEAARELDLPQDKAQALLNRIVPAFEAQADRNLAAAVETWNAEARADTEIGGDRLPKASQQAAQVVQQFGDPELLEIFQNPKLGVGSNRHMIRMLSRLRGVLGDHTFTQGGPSNGRFGDARDNYANSDHNP